MNINSIMELVIFLTVLQTIPVIANFTRPKEGFTADGIKGILEELNKFRSQLALGNFTAVVQGKLYPPGTRILKVKWDPEVAAIAQEYVNTWNGDWDNRPIQYKYFPGLTYQEQYEMSYDQWNDTEYQLLGASAVRNWFYPTAKDGFANDYMEIYRAQMIMASGVGCGIVEKTGRVEGGTLRPYVDSNTLCYFTPRQFIYKEGKTCSECPDETECEESTGLCEYIEKEAPYNGSAGGFNAEGIKTIVDTVNKYRSQIALGNVSVNGTFWPSATNMLKIKWDPELAAIARGHVRYPGLARYWHGWYWEHKMADSEKNRFAENDLTHSLNIVTGKGFTNELSDFPTAQFIMADTSGIGCDAEQEGERYGYDLKCFFAPRRFIYQEGETCSECPLGTKCENATGLCEEDPNYRATQANTTKNISFGLYFLYFLTFYRIHLL